MSLRKSFQNLSKFEKCLWGLSVFVVSLSYFLGTEDNILTLFTSILGVTSLIFVAKGDVIGQLIAVLFSILYAIISYDCRYYGEMITYLFMSAPAAILVVISWIRNPYKGNKQEVTVNYIKFGEVLFLTGLTAVVTTIFYFVLKYFNTAQLALSTFSVTTSFFASYLTFRRNPFYGLAYAANDIVLIGLWVIASIKTPAYIPVILCFVMFLVNDIYGFINWQRIKKRQDQ